MYCIDAGKLIRGSRHIKSIVKGCATTGVRLKVTNAALFFDDDHPEYARIFEALIAECDCSDVDPVIKGNDNGELLSEDFINEFIHVPHVH